jgi:hypothetical protein
MREEKLFVNLLSLGAGAEICIKNKHIGPALILIYSAIDTCGWLDSDSAFATRRSFIDWTEKYLLRAKALQCSALDLYAARCGLLHTLTPDSQLSAEGKARRICYAWGKGKAQDLQRMINLSNKQSTYVAVHVAELYEAWRLGLIDFTEKLQGDPVGKSKVLAKANQFFSEWSEESVTELVEAINESDDGPTNRSG